MEFVELMDIMKGHGFGVFDNAAYIGGICAEGAASYTRKQLDQLTEFVKRPQIGAKGMVYARVEPRRHSKVKRRQILLSGCASENERGVWCKTGRPYTHSFRR